MLAGGYRQLPSLVCAPNVTAKLARKSRGLATAFAQRKARIDRRFVTFCTASLIRPDQAVTVRWDPGIAHCSALKLEFVREIIGQPIAAEVHDIRAGL